MVRLATEEELETFHLKYKELHSSLGTSKQSNNSNHGSQNKVSGINVFARIRPTLEHEKSIFPAVNAIDEDCVAVHRPMISIKQEPKFDSHSFKLNEVFGPEMSNRMVYELACKPLLDLVISGGSSTILAYGQTGSGKTHTIIGCLNCVSEDLFKFENLNFNLSAVEILGNNLTDLFADNTKVNILEDKFGRIQFSGLSSHPVNDVESFTLLIEQAFSKRRTEKTAKNDTSSRSHMIVKLEVQNSELHCSNNGALYVVDLAGSENASDRKQHCKERLAETRLINTSLMTLKDCLRGRSMVLASKTFVHIPYRASKLTLALRECFELAVRRPVKAAVIACVNPIVSDSSHSLNTLRYAASIFVSPSQISLKPNENDPFFWTRQKAINWIMQQSDNKVSIDDLLPVGDGATLAEIPEHDFLSRVLKNGKMTEKRAKVFYLKLWKIIVDARTKNRKQVISARKGLAEKAKLDEEDLYRHINS